MVTTVSDRGVISHTRGGTCLCIRMLSILLHVYIYWYRMITIILSGFMFVKKHEIYTIILLLGYLYYIHATNEHSVTYMLVYSAIVCSIIRIIYQVILI